LKNYTNIIGIIVFSRGIDFWPVKFALIVHAGFIVSHSFPAFFLRVIQYFAVCTKFAIARVALWVYCFVSLGKNFCFVYPSVAGSGCSCSWSFVVARIIAVVGAAVA
jgi:hypothetical protein